MRLRVRIGSLMIVVAMVAVGMVGVLEWRRWASAFDPASVVVAALAVVAVSRLLRILAGYRPKSLRAGRRAGR